MADSLREIAALTPPVPSGKRLAADIRAVMEANRRLYAEHQDMKQQLQPIWKITRHPFYARLKRWRHSMVGRIVTKPARLILRPLHRRLKGS
jgi:hypothetical protein